MDTGTLLVGAFTLLFGIAFCFLGFKFNDVFIHD